MNIFQAIILGLVQGLAEFLPISSSGHLVLLQKIFGISEGTMTFDIILHLATLIPIFVVFRKEIARLIYNPFQKLTFLLIVGTIPAVIVTLLFGDFIDSLFSSGSFLALGFVITGIFLLYADNTEEGDKRIRRMSILDALIIGSFQAVAITPAISRSGSTITAALSRKLTRQTAARFSFLLSIPATAGAVVLQAKKLITGEVPLESLEILPTLLGFIAAALSGFLAINIMLKLLKEYKLKYFSYYVFLLSGLILFDQFVTKMFFK